MCRTGYTYMRNDATAPGPGNKSNVIAMNSHRTETRFPHIAQVVAYWHAVRGARLVPDRSEVDPRGIERALEYAFILEQVAPGVGRLRIAGGHLGDLQGMEVRGMPLSAFFLPEARTDLAATLEQVYTTPTVATLSLLAETGIGRPVLEARLLLLPMTDGFGQITRILGCLDSQGSIGRAPRRFAITARRLTQIFPRDSATEWRGRVVKPSDKTTLPSQPGLAEPPARFDANPQRRFDHLRLIKTDS